MLYNNQASRYFLETWPKREFLFDISSEKTTRGFIYQTYCLLENDQNVIQMTENATSIT